MDYKKKYKEALEWARKVMQGKVGFVLDEVLEKFPELKESEDERIRKELIEHIKANCETDFILFQKFSPDDIIAWLENPTGNDIKEALRTEYEKGRADAIAEVQKSAWSEADETALCDALWAVEQARTIAKDENDMGNLWCAERFLKSIKERVQPQNTWKPSDAQMVVLNDIIINGHLSNANERILKGLQEQLKKLREE